MDKVELPRGNFEIKDVASLKKNPETKPTGIRSTLYQTLQAISQIIKNAGTPFSHIGLFYGILIRNRQH